MQFAMALVSRNNVTSHMSQLLKLTQRQRSEDGLCSFHVKIKKV